MNRFVLGLLVILAIALLILAAIAAFEIINPFNTDLNSSITQMWGCLLIAFGIIATIVCFGEK